MVLPTATVTFCVFDLARGSTQPRFLDLATSWRAIRPEMRQKRLTLRRPRRGMAAWIDHRFCWHNLLQRSFSSWPGVDVSASLEFVITGGKENVLSSTKIPFVVAIFLYFCI